MNKYLCVLFCLLLSFSISAQPTKEITISNTSFYLDNQPFAFNGVSFFNAIYNPAFNKNSTDRKQWMEKFKKYGINVLRVWGQWDNKRGFVDAGENSTLYFLDGRLRQENLNRLKEIIVDANALDMVIELVFFSHESLEAEIRLGTKEADLAVAALTKELMPYRNVVFQIWNEHSDRVVEHYKSIKNLDENRLVTNSPGFGGDLGDHQQNSTLDFLTPHTSRQSSNYKHWELAPEEISYLLKRYNKPVVDDEPARNGTPQFGGPKDGSYPIDHILQIYRMWQEGAYIIYHHDMFQKGYGDPSIPPHGIPDPEFNPYHKAVFEFIALYDRYKP